MGVTPKWMVFLMGKSKTKMDETWRYPDDLGNLHLVLFQPTKGKRSFLPRFLDVFPNNGNPVFFSSYEFPWVHTCGSRARSLSAWTTIRPRTSWDSPRIDISWWFNGDFMGFNYTIYNNIGIYLGYITNWIWWSVDMDSSDLFGESTYVPIVSNSYQPARVLRPDHINVSCRWSLTMI